MKRTFNKPTTPSHWLTQYTFNEIDVHELKQTIAESIDSGYKSSEIDINLVVDLIDRWVENIKKKEIL